MVETVQQIKSASEVAMFIRNKPKFHEAMQRHGYVMPSVNSALCSLEWMEGV